MQKNSHYWTSGAKIKVGGRLSRYITRGGVNVGLAKSEKLARECEGCAKARDYICRAIVDPIGMWKECGDCFAQTKDKQWFEKYDHDIKAYKIKKNFKSKNGEFIVSQGDKECGCCSGMIRDGDEYYMLPASEWDKEKKRTVSIRLAICKKCGDGLNQDYILQGRRKCG